MSAAHGQFVWYELMTTDTAVATAFYCEVIGWTAQDSGLEGHDYTLLSAGETMVGGLMGIPVSMRDAGGRPGWMGYIGVDDVDAMAARVQAEGGRLYRAPEDIPTVGRFAVMGDPQGAVFTLFNGMSTQHTPPGGMTPGRIGWNELHAANWQAAFAFYAGLFGWTKGDAIDMGPMGVYQLFATGAAPVGGMMTASDASLPPHWLYYISVADIDAAVARAKHAGGQLLNGPLEVPGGAWIAQFLDPQGAAFAMVGMRPAG